MQWPGLCKTTCSGRSTFARPASRYKPGAASQAQRPIFLHGCDLVGPWALDLCPGGRCRAPSSKALSIERKAPPPRRPAPGAPPLAPGHRLGQHGHGATATGRLPAAASATPGRGGQQVPGASHDAFGMPLARISTPGSSMALPAASFLSSESAR